MFVVLTISSLSAQQTQSADSVLFPTPAILKDNVAFWKKIYTEVSLNEGLLHDRDYPTVVYKKIDISQRNTWSASRYVEGEKRQVIASLKNIQAAPESLWTNQDKAIAQLFKDGPGLKVVAGAEERIRFQIGQKERFKLGLERSTAYLDTIKAIFCQYNVPAQLAYLPHVESSFNIEAYSKVGAAGLWQFMRGTGKLFLKINYLIDERRDPMIATVAAARLLRQNYNQLHSWPLAITAYNHGLNGMKRAEEFCNSTDITDVIQNYSSPSFQFASKNFYSCFLAASEIAKNPTAYFSDIHFMPKREFRTVVLPSFMRPSVLSKYLDIPEKTIMAFNPSLRAVVYYQQKQIPAGFCIRIPAEVAVPQVEQELAAIPDSLKSAQPERSNYYNVMPNDNLAGIAAHFGITVSQLASANNINRRNRLYAGQVLRIPQASAVAVAVVTTDFVKFVKPAKAVALAQKQTVSMAQSHIALAAAQPKVPLKGVMDKLSDTLGEISTATAAPVPAFSHNVNISVIPRFDASVYNLEVVPAVGFAKNVRIKVGVDETIGHYADWLGVSVNRIRQLNHIGSRFSIRIRNSLTIPGDSATLAKFVKARLEYHMALEEDFYSRYKITDVHAKIVKRGEVLWNICNDADMPMWLFAKYNKDIDLTTLQPGMQVWMPVIEEKSEQDLALESGQPIDIYPLFFAPVNKSADHGMRRIP